MPRPTKNRIVGKIRIATHFFRNIPLDTINPVSAPSQENDSSNKPFHLTRFIHSGITPIIKVLKRRCQPRQKRTLVAMGRVSRLNPSKTMRILSSAVNLRRAKRLISRISCFIPWPLASACQNLSDNPWITAYSFLRYFTSSKEQEQSPMCPLVFVPNVSHLRWQFTHIVQWLNNLDKSSVNNSRDEDRQTFRRVAVS